MTPPLRLSAYFCAYFLYAGALVPYFSLFLAARGYGAGEIAVVLAMPQLGNYGVILAAQLSLRILLRVARFEFKLNQLQP